MPTLPYHLRRLRELGFREAAHQGREVVKRGAWRILEKLYERYLYSDPNESDVIHLCGFSSVAQLVEHFRTRKTPVFFFDEEIDRRIPEFQAAFSDQAAEIIDRAQRALNHEMDLLGSTPVKLDELKPDSRPASYLPWHVDFKSGASWSPATYYKDIRYGQTLGADVKVPWELSRFHHLITLGQAYRLTRDERYALEFVREVTDWIDENPCRYGVNWSCTMEVGIRAVNWIWAFYLFRPSSAISEEFLPKFLMSLYLHARFIRRNLEYREAWIEGRQRRLNSNHYLSNIIGLLYIALLFPEFKLQQEARFAESELEIELFEETMPDGTDYEHSTAYHRLVLEIFMSGFLLLQQNGRSMNPDVAGRLERMSEFVADYMRPDGSAPQIGDSDNGRLHPLSVREYSDHRYLPLIAAEVFHRDDLRLWDEDPELWWWLGKRSRKATHVARESRGYSDTGFYIMRGPGIYVFVSAARVGMYGLGSHSHNDVLSFDYWCRGQSWIVDPGTYVYTSDPPARNWFRSTEAHNTVRVDGVEIDRFQPEQLFQMSDEAPVFVHEWRSTGDHDVLDAEHAGYARLNGRIRHRRRFTLIKGSGELDIHDSLAGDGEHLFEWFFHIAPSATIKREARDFVLEGAANRVLLRTDDEFMSGDIMEGWYSPSYGVRQRAPVIVFRKRAIAPTSAKIRIIPAPL